MTFNIDDTYSCGLLGLRQRFKKDFIDRMERILQERCGVGKIDTALQQHYSSLSAASKFARDNDSLIDDERTDFGLINIINRMCGPNRRWKAKQKLAPAVTTTAVSVRERKKDPKTSVTRYTLLIPRLVADFSLLSSTYRRHTYIIYHGYGRDVLDGAKTATALPLNPLAIHPSAPRWRCVYYDEYITAASVTTASKA
ncbi:hypothetical protein QTP88_027984 [Uroleucon formosanum]